MLSDLIDSPDVLAVYSSPEASVSPPQPVDDANVVESLDNIRSNVAAVIQLGSNNHDAFEAVESSMDPRDDADDDIDVEPSKIRIISCFESKFCFVACCFVGSPRPSMASMVDARPLRRRQLGSGAQLHRSV